MVKLKHDHTADLPFYKSFDFLVHNESSWNKLEKEKFNVFRTKTM